MSRPGMRGANDFQAALTHSSYTQSSPNETAKRDAVLTHVHYSTASQVRFAPAPPSGLSAAAFTAPAAGARGAMNSPAAHFFPGSKRVRSVMSTVRDAPNSLYEVQKRSRSKDVVGRSIRSSPIVASASNCKAENSPQSSIETGTDAIHCVTESIKRAHREMMRHPGPSAAPQEDEELSRLKTGEDAITFFSKVRSAATVKYVYANRSPAALEFCPYDLVVVKQGQENPEHFIISSTGVVHVRPGRPSEVLTIAQWVKEATVFDVLRKVRLFRTYLVVKAISKWHSNVRRHLFLNNRQQLAKTLFIAKKTFCTPAMELFKTAHQLRNVGQIFYEPHGRHDYSIAEFSAIQAQQQESAAAAFECVVDQVEKKLVKVVSAVERRADVPDFANMLLLEQYLLSNAPTAASERKGPGGSVGSQQSLPLVQKSNSMAKAKREQFNRQRQLKQAIVEYSMIGPFVRLVEYFVTENTFQNSLSTAVELFDTIRLQDSTEVKILAFQILLRQKAMARMASTTVSENESSERSKDDATSEFLPELEYTPAQDEVCAVYNDLIGNIVATMNGLPRILAKRTFKHFFEKAPRMWSLGGDFVEDARIARVNRLVHQLISADYEAAKEKMLMYSTSIPSLRFIDVEWDAVKLEWAKHGNTELRCAEVTKIFIRLQQASDSLRVLIASFVGHLLWINASKLKAEVEPRMRAIRDELGAILRSVAHERTMRLHTFFKNSVHLLSGRPVSLRDFAEFVSSVKEISRQLPQVDADVAEAEFFFELMERQQVDAGDDEERQLRERTIGSSRSAVSLRVIFDDTRMQAEEFIDENMKQHVDELSEEVHRLEEECIALHQLLLGDEFAVLTDDTAPVLQYLESIGTKLEEVVVAQESFTRYGVLFGVPPVDWSLVGQLHTLYEAKRNIWELLHVFQQKRDFWFECPLQELSTKEVEDMVFEFARKAVATNRLVQEKGYHDEVLPYLIEEITELRENLPVIQNCGNKHLGAKHWERILQEITGGTYPYNQELNMNILEEFDVYAHKNLIAEEAGLATGEWRISNELVLLKEAWSVTEFQTKEYKQAHDIFILGEIEDIVQQLDDNLLQLQTIMASRFVAPVRHQVDEWMVSLRLISDVIDEWITLQKNWMYLEFIFSSDDIKQQLPEESKQFDDVDLLFKSLTSRAHTVKNVFAICTRDGLLEHLRGSNEVIDTIQKRLEDYLETKRAAFPRFYFLSNDELLSILSDVRNPLAVQPHLTKCFDSIASLVFNGSLATEIHGMCSGEGEVVSFESVVLPSGSVEAWLRQIEAMMKRSLLAHMRETVNMFPLMQRTDWLFKYPAQCIQSMDMISWTADVEHAIANNSLSAYHEEYHKLIISMVDLVKTSLTKLQRTLICTLIVVDVHNRDVTSALIAAKVTSSADFEWVRQLRFYWEQDPSVTGGNVSIRHCNAHLWYGYEYIGNQPRLVITPLTDRAFLTCTTALGMNLGAAPQGPAGTGKTESVKDLGKALARQVVVFNCSDGIDYSTMSRMFAGLAQAGAWACFDEFNRIELEVLSVVAQQMLDITTALSQQRLSMTFDGRLITLSTNFGVFITMNPGYAGRTELPDNLKALFRPICMMIPDYALIAEIMFYSEGFANARTLAQKMVQLYKLSSEQLSKQDHYDFGMRAVKSILVMAGGLKRANPEENEEMLLIRAMRDSNVPKFLRDDTILFMALIRDLFPSVKIQERPNEKLEEFVVAQMQTDRLQPVTGIVSKIMQLYDTLVVRHGVMMVGQTFCAKTTIIKVLQGTLTKMKASGIDASHELPLYNVVHTHWLNPKSVTMGELYGQVNDITREWTDGILSNIARTVTREAQSSEDRHWIVFDGPVDAIWIENMNTVLDDNKMLCLFNGERIKLPSTATFMFEVQDLRVASPATVSRCGMVFVEPFYIDENRGWVPIAETLCQKKAEGSEKFNAARMMELLQAVLPPALDFIRSSCKEWIPSIDAQLAVSCIELMAAFVQAVSDNIDYLDPGTVTEGEAASQQDPLIGTVLTAASSTAPSSRRQSRMPPSESIGIPMLKEFERPPINLDEAEMDTKELFDMYFVMALVWSVGGNLVDDSREKFSDFIKPHLRTATGLRQLAADDFKRSAYDYVVHRKSSQFVSWAHIVPDFRYHAQKPFFDLFVPTVETTSLKCMLRVLGSVSRNVLVNGVTGTGKSAVINDFLTNTLRGDDPESEWEYFGTVFSAQTRGRDVEDRIESKLYKIRNMVLGPSPGKRAIFFVDDLSMPALERYGAAPPIELLRQIITHGGFFDKRKHPATFKEVRDLVFLTVAGVPGGGRNELTKRLTSRFHLLCQSAVSAPSTQRIFTSILNGFMSSWTDEIRALAPTLVRATKDCYDRITLEKLPTPDKSHYTFNLRDFSKVVQGILQVSPKSITDRAGFVCTFIHEVTRVFHDRLVNDEDRGWWWGALSSVVEKRFGMKWKPQYESLTFGDYMRRERDVYEEIPRIEDVQHRLGEFQINFNAESQKGLDLVIFADAAQHISRICRICRQPRGNALLVGMGGSGRQSLCHLAAYVCGMPFLQISISRAYGVSEFREDLKGVLMESGCKNKPVVFFLSDSQIVNEVMLEDVDSVLNTGEVPNMMQPEDLDSIVELVRPLATAAGKKEARNVILSHFVSLCRDNVHIVIGMSPVGEQFRRRLRMFPSLVNCCTIDWFDRWPTEALTGVAARALATSQYVEPDQRVSVAQMCVFIHEDVQKRSAEFFEELRRHNYTTPTSYLALIGAYHQMLEGQNSLIGESMSRYQAGLDKLHNTQILVDEMKEQLVAMQPKLVQAAKDTADIMTKVEKQQGEAEVIQGECAAEEAVAGAIRKEADGIRAECQAELDKALPILKAAEDALNELRPDDIREVKSFLKPASRVVLVMEAVLILLGEKDLSWDRAKIVMGRLDFIKDLQTYKKDDLTEKTIKQLQKYITNPDFQPDEVAKSSKACRSLSLWVLAINNYFDVVKVVAPKRQSLAEAEERLGVAAKALEAAQQKLKEIRDRVSALQREMEDNIRKKKELEADIELTTKRLTRAEQLMSGLSSEQARWAVAVKNLSRDKAALVGSMLLAAGCIAYLGPFTAPYRKRMLQSWSAKCRELGIPVGAGDFDLTSVVNQATVRSWWQLGLPQDAFSVENAIIATKSQRWCLCIDPQGQAVNWIRAMERENNIRIVKLADANCMRTLENAIKVGLPALVESVDEAIDASLDPILLKQTYRSQGRLLLKVGDVEVDYDPAFRLYITTKLPNPHFLPELQIKVTIINFTVTEAGLENQLLADVVRFEYVELEQRANKTVSDIDQGKQQLSSIEERILYLLTSSTGNILDNEALINTLSDAKHTSQSVSDALKVAEETQRDIEAARNRYRPVATRGALTYSVITEVANIDHMYQISLDFFKKLFLETLRRTEKAEDVDERVALLLPAVTLDSYNTICRGLFERDKLLFAFLLFSHVYRAAGVIEASEWLFFLKGSEGRKLVDPEEDFWPCWLNESSWNELTALSQEVPIFRTIKDDMYRNESAWEKWIQQEQLLDTLLPPLIADASPWHKLLVIKAVRENLVTNCMRTIVGHYMGASFMESPAFNIEACFADSSPTSPIIFVLTPGTDPTVLFTEYAAKSGYGERKLMLSLGQDQGLKAEEMIDTATKQGMWVYLQNCHVYQSWMPRLERVLEELQHRPVHQDFRLWLTTMPTTSFPTLVLQCGIKVVKEPPKGLKANLRDNFLVEISEDLWDSCPINPTTWRRLLCSLTYFHAIIQERRKFGALGWNIPYEWNQSDLTASVRTLHAYLGDSESEVSWKALRYLMGVINYGGRVTDFLDSRALTTILDRFLAPDVVAPNTQWNVTADGIYHIPENLDSLGGVRDYLATLPPYESPELFGLHANADVTFNRHTARRQLATILSVQPRAKAEAGLSPEQKVLRAAAEFVKRLPAPIDKTKAHPETYRIMEDGSMFSLGTVVGQEIDFFNSILTRLQRYLSELQRAIKGEVIMSTELEAMFDSFLLGQVPQAWHENGYLSLKPLASWFEDTLSRIEFFRRWNNCGPPVTYWLSGFFFPQGFLTGILQAHSRRHGIPIDDIVFRTHVTTFSFVDDVDELPETGAYIHGLFMEGARFDDEKLTICESRKGELFTSVPVIWLEPVRRSTEASANPLGNLNYSCPVYKTSARAGALSTTGLSTNYVISLDLPSGSLGPSHWILRGVALLCMLDD